MQNEQAQSTVTLNGEQAKNELTALEIKAKKLKEQILAANKAGDTKAFEKYSQQLKETNKQMSKMQREAFDVKKVLDNLSGASLKDLEAAQRKLNATMRSGEIKRGTKEWDEYRANLVLVKNEIRNITRENQAGATSMGKMSMGFKQMITGAIAGIAALTGITAKLEEFRQKRMELEDAQASLKSITGLTDEDIEWLTKQARKLSTATTEDGVRIKATSKEILEGYTIIGSKRPELLKNKEAMAEVTKQALTLAAAGKVDVSEAFEAVTASMNQFNLEADQSNRIINVLGAGSLEGSAEISDLAGSMKNVGTVADTSNLSIEQTVALLEVLASKQLLGEEAGTKLRGAILKMKEANVGYASGMFNMRDAIDEVNEKLSEKRNAAERDAYMQKVFGTENITAGMILLDNVEAYDRLTKAITGTTVAQEQARINTSTSSVKWAQMKNLYNETGMNLVKNLNPALLGAANAGLSVLKVMAAHPAILISLISVIGLLTGAYIANTVASVANTLWLKASAAATEFAESRTAKFTRTLLKNPYVLIAASVIALTAVIYKLATAKTAAEKAQSDYNKQVAIEVAKSNDMFEALKKTNEGSEDRRVLITKINEQYGSYLGYQLTEKDNLEKINKAQKDVNSSLREKLALQIKESAKADIITASVGKQVKEAEKLTKIIANTEGDGAAEAYVSQIQKIMESGKFSEKSIDGAINYLKSKLGKNFTPGMDLIVARLGHLSAQMNSDLSEVDSKFDRVINTSMTAGTGGGTDAPSEGDERTINGKLMVFHNGKWGLKKTKTPPTTDEEKKKALQKKLDVIDTASLGSINNLKQKSLDGDESVNTEQKLQDTLNKVVVDGLEKKKNLYAKGSQEYLQLDSQILDIKLKAQEDAEKRSKDLAAKSLESFKKSHESELSTAKANDQLARVNIENDLESGVLTQDAYNDKIEEQDRIAAAERLRIAKEYSKDVKTFQFASEDERISIESAANEELLAAQKAYQATKKKLIKDDLETINEIEQRNGLTDFQKKRSQYRSDLAILKDALKNKKISIERYNEDVRALNSKFAQSKAEDVLAVANQAATFSSRLQETEALAVENKYARQLKAAEGNAEATAALQEKMENEKKSIKKKYADIDLTIAIAQITANTAAAIMKAAPNIPLQIITGLTGAAEMALAVQQRNQIKNLWTGGFTEPGDKFAPAGIVHKGEFVGSQDAVRNSSIRRIFDLVDYAQKTNTVARITNDDIVKAAGIRRGFSAGGFGNDSTTSIRRVPNQNSSSNSDERYLRVLERVEKKLGEPFVGYVSITGQNGIEQQTAKYNRMIKNVSR